MTQTETQEKFDQWAIVEVMGHKKYAGRVTEQQIAGAGLVRVDVPEVVLGESVAGEDGRALVMATDRKRVGLAAAQWIMNAKPFSE